MIFFADGRSRTLGLELISTIKATLLLLAIAFLIGSVAIAYNFYNLGNVRSSYTQTMQNLSAEQQDIKKRLVELENFEEKISFFLGMLPVDYNPTPEVSYQRGIGGGEELETVSTGGLESEVGEDVFNFPSLNHENEKTDVRVKRLKKRLEELADLALLEKKRLDYTPSILPAQGYMTSRFGYRRSPFTGRRHFHRGIDLVNKLGTPIKATAAGTIIFAGKELYWGNAIFIEHRDGIVSKYGHLSEIKVRRGAMVGRGDLIGLMGMSGRTTGPHLHYQIEINDKAVDPTKFVIEELD